MHFGYFTDMKGISQIFQGLKSNDMLEIAQVSKQINNQRYIADKTAIILKVGHHNILILRIAFYNLSVTSLVFAKI